MLRQTMRIGTKKQFEKMTF